MPMNSRKNRRTVAQYLMMSVICLILAGYFCVRAVEISREYSLGDEAYESLREVAEAVDTDDHANEDETVFPENGDAVSDSTEQNEQHIPAVLPELPDEPLETVTGISDTIPDYVPRIDFKALRKVNRDIVGWLYLPGTVIDYPVVQGSDNSYYLNHLANGEKNSNGCLFVDHRNNADDDNTVIYGHNMRSGKMLACLMNYKSQEFYDDHPCLYYITEGRTYRMEIFSAHTVKADADAYLRSIPYGEYADWLVKMKRASLISTKADPAADDRILTLSTCTYDFSGARFVVQGRLIPLIEAQTGGEALAG